LALAFATQKAMWYAYVSAEIGNVKLEQKGKIFYKALIYLVESNGAFSFFGLTGVLFWCILVKCGHWHVRMRSVCLCRGTTVWLSFNNMNIQLVITFRPSLLSVLE